MSNTKLSVRTLLMNKALPKEDDSRLAFATNFILALQHRFPDERVDTDAIIEQIDVLLNLGKEIEEK